VKLKDSISMHFRSLFRTFTDIAGCTPLHPQFFSRSFLTNQVRLHAPSLSGTVADLGCGSSPYKRFFKQTRYIGLDYPAPTHVERSKQFDICGDLTCLPVATDRLDGVLCTQVLEHLNDPFQAISEIARVLRPGGKLILSFPFFYPLHDEPHDYFRYSPHGMNILLSKAGLQVTQIVPQGGFINMAGEFLNLFCIHKILNLLSSGSAKRILGICLMPMVWLMACVINLICILLSSLDHERRFVMNYVILAEKVLRREA
jgi:SAM-dependent methyltransferase